MYRQNFRYGYFHQAFHDLFSSADLDGPFQRRVDGAPPSIIDEMKKMNLDEDKDENEDVVEEMECPLCDVQNFGASYCNSSLVISATVTENKGLRLHKIHKGTEVTNEETLQYEMGKFR